MRTFTAAIALATVSMIVGGSTALEAASGPPTVSTIVVNPPTAPVPVTVLNSANAPASTAINNPPTAPALGSSVDEPGRIPYQAQTRVDNNCNTARNNCSGLFPAVPAGHRLVVKHISVRALDGRANYVTAFIGYNSGMLTEFFVPVLPPFNPATPSNPQIAVVDQAVQLYIDPIASNGNNQWTASISTDGDFGPAAQVSVTATGYLLDCTANICAAITP